MTFCGEAAGTWEVNKIVDLVVPVVDGDLVVGVGQLSGLVHHQQRELLNRTKYIKLHNFVLNII